MPFSPTPSCSGENEWTDIFNEVFVAAYKECGYQCERASLSTGNLIKSIIVDLQKTWLAMADLTDRNANVFYELGVRHTLSKRTILVAQNIEHIPSDLQGYWCLVYGTKPGEVAKFKRDIKELILKIEANPENSDSPISDFVEHAQVGISSYLTRENIKRVSALFTELTANINTLKEILSNDKYREFLTTECLSLLLNTLYLDVGPDLLRQCHELRHNLRSIICGLRLEEDFLKKTIDLGSSVLNQVHILKTNLSIGQFVEPHDISTMVWEPLAQDKSDNSESSREYSRSKDLSKIDLDDLRKHFDGLDL